MITNPYIDQSIRVMPSPRVNPAFHNLLGKIVSTSGEQAWIRLDFSTYGQREWSFSLEFLEPAILSPEEQEQKRREQHAEKYL